MKRFSALIFISSLFIGSVLVVACAEVERPRDEAKEAVGDSARDLLDDDDFTKVLLEIQYVGGFRPTNNTVDNIKEFLEQYLNKPQGIEVQVREISSPGKDRYSVNDIRAIEDNNRTVFNEDKRLGVYMLFIDGNHSDDTQNSKVLGVAYRNTSTVIYQKTLQENSGGIGEPSAEKLETSVALHELGHLMGLVNVGTPMQTDHQDEAHGKHCDVEECLMYYAVETGAFIDNLVGSPIPTLDSQCEADLRANGGK